MTAPADQAALALLQNLPSLAFAFVLLIARIGTVLMLLPGIGEAELPMTVRAGFALALSALLLPVIQPLLPAVPDDIAGLAAMIASEIVTGLWLGWMTRMAALALPIAGQIIAYMLGLSNVLQPDPDLGAQATALGRMLGLAAPLFVLVSGLYAPVLAALAGSYRLVPPGAPLPVGDLSAAVLATLTQGFALALRLAGPFVLGAVVWQAAIGLIARLVPRLQVYFIAMPAQILGGLALFAALLPMLLRQWQTALGAAYAALPGL